MVKLQSRSSRSDFKIYRSEERESHVSSTDHSDELGEVDGQLKKIRRVLEGETCAQF